MRFKVALLCFVILTLSRACCAQMVRSDKFQQDQTKVNLCIDRARHDRSFGIGIGTEELIPFEIDMGFVERSRRENPDVTFFATTRGLIECEVTGIGKYGPMTRYLGGVMWKALLPDVPSFQPSISTVAGKRIAVDRCLAELPAHGDLPNFEHAGHNDPYSVGYLGSKADSGRNHPMIAGVPVSSNDVMVTGAAYFKTNTIDQIMLLYTCLYSPMLELKAVGWRKNLPGPQVWLKSARMAEAQTSQVSNKMRHP